MSRRSTATVRNPHLVSVDFAEIDGHLDEPLSQHLVGALAERDHATCMYYNAKVANTQGGDVAFHSHPFDQIIYVLSGRLHAQIEGEEAFTADPGDVVIYPAGVVHRNWVDGPERATHLTVNTPPTTGVGPPS